MNQHTEDAVDVEQPELDHDDEASVSEEGSANGSTKAERLEEEGDIAADYLEELLDVADIDGDIDIEVRSGRTYISIVSDEADNKELEALVGRDGEVLESLQELTRLAVLTSTGNRSRLVLDILGYRKEREGELREIADKAIEEAQSSNEPVHLAPMSAYERKLVHDVVADAGLFSESEGEGAKRHIVVSVEELV
ncbi:protein jag [Neomicrococcus aestuarii]|jgi:spoIIIJ-associated protein|uniref:RNA-binding protein n=1 Tax=Neomicrococcus aestuarii TaxID=556325 RepID=A0A1L2ZPP6_9MICC|nr:R3H domain-containing nucleic acid-binding protein [Neomicrococcus aestuarii]APF40998.1 RNA-binding protein [Neomicrococcus aestuarii]